VSCLLTTTDGAVGLSQAAELDSAAVQQPSSAHHRVWVFGSPHGGPHWQWTSTLLYGKRAPSPHLPN